MSEFKSKLLEKVLNEEYLTDFELKKYEEYLKKVNGKLFLSKKNNRI